MGLFLIAVSEFFKRNPRTILYAILGIIFLIGVTGIVYILHENSKLTKENTSLSIANKSMKDTIDKGIKSSNISSQTHVDISKSETEVDKKKTEVIDDLNQKENEIRKKYETKVTQSVQKTVADKPITTTPVVDNSDKMSDELASVRIDSLNKIYCTYSNADQNVCGKD